MSLILSDKYKAFCKHVLEEKAIVDVLEGTTAAGKTTVGAFAFISKIYNSRSDKASIISGLDTGTIEKNIINAELGILDIFGSIVQYNGGGTSKVKQSHLVVHGKYGDKIVYIFGYGDRAKWKKNLGAQYYATYIDEVNIADIDYVRETVMRSDYTLMTLNPDDPNLPIYKEYINCCRPLEEYRQDAPNEINNMLTEEPKPGYVHWFFSFKHNAGLSQKKKDQIILNVPKGTKLYKNKVLGIRGRATGLVFGIFDRKHHVITKEDAKKYIKNYAQSNQIEWFEYFTAGLDTSYSQKSPDTIAMTFAGITNKGKYVLLSERVYSNADLEIPIAPSDTVINFVDFLNRNKDEWGLARNVFIDSADQATQTELKKYKRAHPECIYMFNDAHKKVTNIDRIVLQLGWMSYDDEHGKEPCFFIVSDCTEYIGEMDLYSWDENKDNTPEDGHDHVIQSSQYGWIPYRTKIYRKEKPANEVDRSNEA